MKWEKRGSVFGPAGDQPWARHSALQPTPILIDEDTIRIFFGSRDDDGMSRAGFVDVDAADPGRVLHVGERPVLDIGEPGAFDDNGVVPCALADRPDGLYLYYAGYQIPTKTKFLVFAGLAISQDGGRTFVRRSFVPLLDRTDEEVFFRVIHSIRQEDGRWRAWYGGGSSFITEGDKQLPVYDVRYMESPDGVTFPQHGKVSVTFTDPDEYRIGRPYVIHTEGLYRMFYGTARRGVGYRLGYAESEDGHKWSRKDETVGIDVTEGDWDGNMVAYPSVITARGRTYMFYNGNNMGRSGFGFAELVQW